MKTHLNLKKLKISPFLFDKHIKLTGKTQMTTKKISGDKLTTTKNERRSYDTSGKVKEIHKESSCKRTTSCHSPLLVKEDVAFTDPAPHRD